MTNLFNPTEYDYIVGKTIKEEYLNNEDIYEGYNIEELKQMKEQFVSEINNLLTWYYLTSDAVKQKENEERRKK